MLFRVIVLSYRGSNTSADVSEMPVCTHDPRGKFNLRYRICPVHSIWNLRTNFIKKKLYFQTVTLSLTNHVKYKYIWLKQIYITFRQYDPTNIKFNKIPWFAIHGCECMVHMLWIIRRIIPKRVLHFTVSIKIYWVEVN